MIKVQDQKYQEKIDAAFSEFNKIALKKINVSPEEFNDFLGTLVMAGTFAQHAHWISKGDPQYGDHLLFMRIYEGISSDIDSLAEKSIGLVGDAAVNPLVTLLSASAKLKESVHFKAEAKGRELAAQMLQIETYVLEYIEEFYKACKSSDNLTLGLDDYLMSLHSKHEDFCYLLKQRVK